MGDVPALLRGNVTSDGIEPPLSDLESEVLPLHHEAVLMQRQLSVVGIMRRCALRSPRPFCDHLQGRVAQSVERRSDKAKVLGSSPSMTTTSTFWTR